MRLIEQTEGGFLLPELGVYEPNSPEWDELRKGKIGGSSVGAIMGLSPWRSALTEYYIATGEYDPLVEPSMSMRLGTILELPILTIFEQEHPELEVLNCGTYGNEWATINPDAFYKRPDGSYGLIEVKFSRDYMSEIPPHYKAQMTFYMGLLGIKQGVLVALAGSGYIEHWIDFDEFEFTVMQKKLADFRKAVATRQRPEFEGSESTYQTMRELYSGVEDEQVELGDLGVHLVNAKLDFDKAETHLKEMKSRTLDALGNAKFGVVDGQQVCYRTQRGNYAPSLTIKVKGN